MVKTFSAVSVGDKKQPYALLVWNRKYTWPIDLASQALCKRNNPIYIATPSERKIGHNNWLEFPWKRPETASYLKGNAVLNGMHFSNTKELIPTLSDGAFQLPVVLNLSAYVNLIYAFIDCLNTWLDCYQLCPGILMSNFD